MEVSIKKVTKTGEVGKAFKEYTTPEDSPRYTGIDAEYNIAVKADQRYAAEVSCAEDMEDGEWDGIEVSILQDDKIHAGFAKEFRKNIAFKQVITLGGPNKRAAKITPLKFDGTVINTANGLGKITVKAQRVKGQWMPGRMKKNRSRGKGHFDVKVWEEGVVYAATFCYALKATLRSQGILPRQVVVLPITAGRLAAHLGIQTAGEEPQDRSHVDDEGVNHSEYTPSRSVTPLSDGSVEQASGLQFNAQQDQMAHINTPFTFGDLVNEDVLHEADREFDYGSPESSTIAGRQQDAIGGTYNTPDNANMTSREGDIIDPTVPPNPNGSDFHEPRSRTQALTYPGARGAQGKGKGRAVEIDGGVSNRDYEEDRLAKRLKVETAEGAGTSPLPPSLSIESHRTSVTPMQGDAEDDAVLDGTAAGFMAGGRQTLANIKQQKLNAETQFKLKKAQIIFEATMKALSEKEQRARAGRGDGH